jgi:hypothetical protein
MTPTRPARALSLTMGTKLLTPFLPLLVLAAPPAAAQQGGASGSATSQIKIGRTVELNKDGSVKQVIPAKVEGGQKVEAPQQPQDPQKPAAIDRIDELRSQLERAKAELDATRRMAEAGGFPARARPFLVGRGMEARTLDLGVEAIPKPEPTAGGGNTPRPNTNPIAAPAGGARVATDDDAMPAGAIATVNGQAITEKEFETVLDYFKSRPGNTPEEQTRKDAMRALIVQKAALARFSEKAGPARQKIEDLEKLLAAGADFADIAKKHSQCPSSSQGGDLGFFRRGMMDPMFEMAAFQTKVGERSAVVQSGFGYHLINVASHEEKEGVDQVRASHILVMFDEDQQAVRQVMMEAMQGRVDLVFASDNWLASSPF